MGVGAGWHARVAALDAVTGFALDCLLQTSAMTAAPHRPRTALAVALAVTLVVAAACSSGSSPAASSSTQFTVAGSVVGENQPSDPFYQSPNPLPSAPPGTIIRSEPMDGAP